MIGGISSIGGAYGVSSAYYTPYNNQAQSAERAAQAQSTQQVTMTNAARRVSQPEVPVQPVTPVKGVSANNTNPIAWVRQGADPVEMAVRMRIQYPEDGAQQANAAQNGAQARPVMPGAAEQAPKAEYPTLPGQEEEAEAIPGLKQEDGAKSAQEVAEEGECQTCKERKYQDGSDDPGVSFKTPTNVDPSQAAAAVRGHEMEHVTREQAKAQQEGRKVVSQNVTYHTGICPECGDVYVSGGTTRTVTKADNSAEQQQAQQEAQTKQNQNRQPFSAVA